MSGTEVSLWVFGAKKHAYRVLTHAGNEGMISAYTDDYAFYRAEFASLGVVSDSVITDDDSNLANFINEHIEDCEKRAS